MSTKAQRDKLAQILTDKLNQLAEEDEKNHLSNNNKQR